MLSGVEINVPSAAAQPLGTKITSLCVRCSNWRGGGPWRTKKKIIDLSVAYTLAPRDVSQDIPPEFILTLFCSSWDIPPEFILTLFCSSCKVKNLTFLTSTCSPTLWYLSSFSIDLPWFKPYSTRAISGACNSWGRVILSFVSSDFFKFETIEDNGIFDKLIFHIYKIISGQKLVKIALLRRSLSFTIY